MKSGACARSGSMHLSERRRSDGRVIEVRGQPLPDGGFVSTFNDVTTYTVRAWAPGYQTFESDAAWGDHPTELDLRLTPL